MKQTDISKRFQIKMSLASTLAAIMIVIHHVEPLRLYAATNKAEEWLITSTHEIAVVAMSWFFFVAGYWLFRGITKEQIVPRIKKRLFSLGVPYIIWNSLQLIVLIPMMIFFGYELPGTKLSLYIRSAYQPICPIDGPLWFIFRTLEYVMLLPLLYIIIVKHRNIQLQLIAAQPVIIYLTNSNYWTFMYWLFIFMFGGWVATYKDNDFQRFIGREGKLPWPVTLILSVVLTWAVAGIVMSDAEILKYILRLFMIPAYSCLVSISKTSSDVKWIDNPSNHWFIRGYSFWLFASHWYILNILQIPLTAIIIAEQPYAASIYYIINAIVTVAIQSGLMILVHKHIPVMFKYMMGGRKV